MQIIIKSLRRKNAVTCIFTIITCYCSHYHNIMSNIYVDCNRHFCGKFHSCFFASEKERKLIYWIKSLMWILYCTGVIIFDNLRLVRIISIRSWLNSGSAGDNQSKKIFSFSRQERELPSSVGKTFPTMIFKCFTNISSIGAVFMKKH